MYLAVETLVIMLTRLRLHTLEKIVQRLSGLLILHILGVSGKIAEIMNRNSFLSSTGSSTTHFVLRTTTVIAQYYSFLPPSVLFSSSLSHASRPATRPDESGNSIDKSQSTILRAHGLPLMVASTASPYSLSPGRLPRRPQSAAIELRR